MSVVNVVVTCTKDKKYPVAENCQLRNVTANSLAARLKEWQARLNSHWRERVAVRDLYSGDHWANVCKFESSHFDIDIWVCSAGFGLVRFHDTITPYAATFSGNHPDSVASNLATEERLDASRHWWKSMCRWRAHFKDRPRSLAGLMAAYPKRSLLVVASKTYLRAIADDLREGVSCLASPDQLSIVSAGAKSLEGLSRNLIPCDASLQAETGGARRSLNTRLAGKILREARVPPTSAALAKHFRELLQRQPPITKYERRPMTDDQVKYFIRQKLRINESMRHTPLLRLLRESDMACEQKRFASLYKQVRDEIDG